jgi:hypothetical protein
VDPFAHVAFAVRLKAYDLDAELFCERLQFVVDLLERGGSVLLGIPFSEHVVIYAVQHQKRFHGVFLCAPG